MTCHLPARILFLAFVAGSTAVAFAAHSKARSVEQLDASFQIGPSGAIEASLDPPIQGVLRIVVRARASSSGRPQQGADNGARPSQDQRQPLTLEVTQWDRPVPFRLVNASARHSLFAGRPSLLVADIDVNDLTPGVPVRVRIHSDIPDSPGLDAHAYAIVY